MLSNEKFEKKWIYEQEMKAQTGGATVGLSPDTSCGESAQPGLLDRVNHQKREAERSSHRASRLGELEYLLGKNPEVARILDLMEDVRR